MPDSARVASPSSHSQVEPSQNGKPEVTCIRTSLPGSVVTSASRSTGACGEPEPGAVGGHVAVGGPEDALALGGGQDLEDAGGVGVDVDGKGDGSVHGVLQVAGWS